MDRRSALVLGTALLVSSQTQAQETLPLLATDSMADSNEVLPLWPTNAPDDLGAARKLAITERSKDPARYHDRAATGISSPDLTIYRPAKPDGSALLLMPGGGYDHVTTDKEGADVAREFARSGITSFVLRYRLPPEGWRNSQDAPLQDAQRAMRLIRARAARYSVDPARLGVMGFSAGGHLAATMATRGPDVKAYDAVDEADALDCRPNFAGLIYAGVMMGGRNIEPNPTPEQIAARAPLHHVSGAVPPSFLCQNIDDPQVPVANLILFFEALRKASVPCELHLFEKGGHGFGIRGALGTPTAIWPRLFVAWGASHGFFRTPALN
ncbi:MAG TPA: alpha/beta hydrolase [Rhizomicrobium sp.]|nr:alpha/beta hydrolase [Rhizomicrobium sp.]